MAPLVRTGGSRHTGLAALPHRNIHTITEHMPEDHQKYLEWNGDRFRKWAERIGINTYTVVNAILTSKSVEQQTYRSCMGLLKLAEKYSDALLEAACKKALSYTSSPSCKYRPDRALCTVI